MSSSSSTIWDMSAAAVENIPQGCRASSQKHAIQHDDDGTATLIFYMSSSHALQEAAQKPRPSKCQNCTLCIPTVGTRDLALAEKYFYLQMDYRVLNITPNTRGQIVKGQV